MNKFKNMKFRFLVMPMITITVITSLILCFQTYNQYKKVNDITNQTIANIIGWIKENYPEIDTTDIIRILNLDKMSTEFQYGKDELLKYGINTQDLNSIVAVQNQMIKNARINGIIILLFSFLWIIAILIYLNKREKKLKKITEYIYEINNKSYKLDIDDNSEDELSNLKNELYKITVMLKEESENSKKDKENLKMSVEDISHQLKTPLTSISIMLDNIKNDINMDDNVRQKFIFEISRQIDWINWLVISMLKLSKLDADIVEFCPKIINVRQFINEIVKNLEIPIEIKNQKVIVDGVLEASFYGDYKWQQEAVTNILKNCIEHNRDGGNIFIKYEENSLYTKICIKDEGEGIDKKDLKHIFERFYKGKNSSENSVGIGLALAKSIIEKDNGIISCRSNLGEGTEFVIKYMKS